MNKRPLQTGEIAIYRSKDGKAELEVKLREETLWLRQEQIAQLFGIKRPAITKHLKNIFDDGELNKKSVSSILEHTAADGKIYKTQFYNLDAIISVGYRVNSKRATQFRIWATSVLKNHIINGYTLNQKRLQEKGLNEFEEAVGLIKKTLHSRMLTDDETRGLLDVITGYSSTWILLQKYDKATLAEPKKHKAKKKFDYKFAKKAVDQLKFELSKKKEATDLFGNERGGAFEGVIGALNQTFDKKELYESIEEKAAHLLYFVIKDHPFTDGNKRIGSFLFIVYLAKNSYLYRKNGEKKITDNTLTALALLIAESDPKHKKLMILLIMNFLTDSNKLC